MHAVPGTLTLRAEAGSEETLKQLQDLLTTRLEKIGSRDHLAVNWQVAETPGEAGLLPGCQARARQPDVPASRPLPGAERRAPGHQGALFREGRPGRRPREDLRERRPRGVVPQLAARGPGRRRGAGQLAEEFVECGLALVDGGPLVVGEGDGGEHALEVVLGFQQQRPG